MPRVQNVRVNFAVFVLLSECENLIRHMLVKDPNNRYTIEQIKKHKWMQMDPAVESVLEFNDLDLTETVPPDVENTVDGYNEQALGLMQGLGIDIVKTKKVCLLFVRFCWQLTDC